VPVVLGVSWFTNFDNPQQDSTGRYWIGRGNLGSIRGGHAIMVKSVQPDAATWWAYYNQGAEGACVGFSCSRMMSHYNRARYQARWLYHEAQKVDPWPGENYSGTSVSAACDVLRTVGHKLENRLAPWISQGITANRWITTVDQIHQTIGLPLADKLGAVPLLNSWGTGYPRVVWLPDQVLARLLDEDGECVVVTDR
jgi:hypothetical protein